jgi:excisionase family DNA binding protein
MTGEFNVVGAHGRIDCPQRCRDNDVGRVANVPLHGRQLSRAQRPSRSFHRPIYRSACRTHRLAQQPAVVEWFAEWLATSPRHIRRLVAERRVPFVKVGDFIRFDPDDITLWIEEQKVRIDED